MTTLVLTRRDMALLGHLAIHRECDVDDVALEFFAANPFTSAPNARAGKVCARRLARLRDGGYLDIREIRDGGRARRVVTLAARADQPLAERASRRTISTKERVHHLRTLDAIRAVERHVAARGGRVLQSELEPSLRARALRGRRTRRGDAFSSFPDAVCTAAFTTSTGAREVKIAVEYVTSKYCDADIREKHESFGAEFGEVFWFADKNTTTARVARITGATCSTLS